MLKPILDKCDFSALKYDLSLERRFGSEELLSQDDINEFRDQITLLNKIVSEELALKEFTRIGFRIWYAFSCKSVKEAVEWISGLGWLQVHNSLENAFEGKKERFG